MPHRGKHEAQRRLDLGMARVLMAQAKDAPEGVKAFREHFAIVDELDSSKFLAEHRDNETADEIRSINEG